MPFYRLGLCKNAGLQILRQRLRVIHAISFYCASSLVVFPINRKSPDFTARLHLLTHQRPLRYGLRPALPQGICCRVAVKLHQNVPSQSTIPGRASLESRSAGASDAVPPRRRKPRKIWPVPSIPHTDTPFSGRCRFRKGEKDRYRGGHDAPENFLLTQAACTAYSLKLPTPQQPATPA